MLLRLLSNISKPILLRLLNNINKLKLPSNINNIRLLSLLGKMTKMYFAGNRSFTYTTSF